ncbi:MAG: hypothetical protein AAB529_00340 [Patescibacteria group bacterium]
MSALTSDEASASLAESTLKSLSQIVMDFLVTLIFSFSPFFQSASHGSQKSLIGGLKERREAREPARASHNNPLDFYSGHSSYELSAVFPPTFLFAAQTGKHVSLFQIFIEILNST